MSEGLDSTLDKNFLLYCKEVGNNSLLSRQEEFQVATQIHSGDDVCAENARHKLIRSNLRLVMKVAKEYKNLGLDMADLISEGNLGLMRAADKFDPHRGTKFSTYACFWIKQSIRRALSNKSRTIRLPVHLTQLYHSIIVCVRKYEVEHGCEPSDTQIADSLNVSIKKIKNVRSANLLNNFTHLDEKFEKDGEKEKVDIIEDSNIETPSQKATRQNDIKVLREEMIENLDEREQSVIRYRFGLDNVDCCTLEQLGVRYGITRERIRQIEMEALRKLRRKLEKKM